MRGINLGIFLLEGGGSKLLTGNFGFPVVHMSWKEISPPQTDLKSELCPLVS